MSNDRYQVTKKVTIVGMCINLLLAVIKMLIGTIGRSPALFADGIHSLSDLISDAMVLFATKYAAKKEDENHPYGHERIETIATLALSLFLVIIGFLIIYHAINNILNHSNIQPNKSTIFAAIFSIIGNEFIYQYTIRVANKINSDILRANAWHSRSDMWSSVIVLIGLVGAFLGFAWMDTVAALIICYMIIKMGIKWGYSSISELIDEGVDNETRKKIVNIITSCEGVINFHHLRTRKMAGKIILDVHILVDKYSTASEGHYIAEVVRATIYNGVDNIKDIIVHVDVTEHEEVIKLENIEPSRQEISKAIENLFKAKNIDTSIISDKRMTIFYLDDSIEVELYVKKSKELEEHLKELENLKYADYNIKVNVFKTINLK